VIVRSQASRGGTFGTVVSSSTLGAGNMGRGWLKIWGGWTEVRFMIVLPPIG